MPNFTFNPKGHSYELDGKKMTGVTTVLGVLAKPALIGWAANMTASWIRENCTRDDSGIWEVSEDSLLEAVKAHTKKKEAAGEKGTDLHSQVEGFIKSCLELNHGDPHNMGWPVEEKMLGEFVEWAVVNNIKFLASEKQVYSKDWFCAGTFDFSFEKDGKRFIGDLKTMGKIWDRVPHFQTAAYRKMSVEMGEPDYDGTCIVNISKPTEKYPSELTESWSYDWESDQKAFESALYLYRQLNQ